MVTSHAELTESSSASPPALQLSRGTRRAVVSDGAILVNSRGQMVHLNHTADHLLTLMLKCGFAAAVTAAGGHYRHAEQAIAADAHRLVTALRAAQFAEPS